MDVQILERDVQPVPFDTPGSLSNDEAYALTAFLLHMNDIVPIDDVIDATNLAQV